MKARVLSFLAGALCCAGYVAGAASADNGAAQLQFEQKHFLDCLAQVYNPALWVSHDDRLYFLPKTEAQTQQLEAMKAARAAYVVLTNRETRYTLATQVLAESGLTPDWQQKLLLPYSPTNQNLTPTLTRPVRFVSRFKLVQALDDTDALIQDDQTTYFVMGLGRGPEDRFGTNVVLVKEGIKTYSTGDGGSKRVEAFSSASLSAEETAALKQAAEAFRKRAAGLGQVLAQSSPAQSDAAREEFESCKARATDSSPYMQFLLAKRYLEGNGTEKDEETGMEWMKAAARNGSGDAKAFLAAKKPASAK